MSQFQSQSQSQSQSEGSIWASIPLVKFSHVNYTSTRGSPPWSHLNYKDLKAVVKRFRVVDEHGNYGQRVTMEVFSAVERLELLDLSQLVRILQCDASMVEIAEHSPRLALRWPGDAYTTRKCQMRFHSDEDFSIIISALRDLGLPTKPNMPQIPVLPSPAPSAAMSLSPALPSDVLHYASRPTSASSNSSQARSSSTRLPPYAEFKVPARPDTAESLRQRPRSAQSTFGALDSLANSITLPSPSPSYATSFHEPLKSLYLSQLDRESQNHWPSNPVSQETGYDNISSHPKPSAFLHQLQMQQGHDGVRSTSRPRLLSQSPFFSAMPKVSASPTDHSSDPLRASVATASAALANLEDMAVPPRRELPFGRPASTPAELQDLMIPPRRKLPFSRPQSKPRSSSIAGLPPLPKPTPVTKTNPGSSTDVGSTPEPAKADPTKRIAQRTSPVPKPTQESNLRAVSPLESLTNETTITPPKTHDDEPPLLAAKSASITLPASATSRLVLKASAPAKKRAAAPIRPPSAAKRPKMVDQATQTRTLSVRDHTVKGGVDSPSLAPEVVPSTVAAAPPASFLNDLDNFVASRMSRPAQQELWQMSGYAEADADRRHKMLDEFICQSLEDPDFLQLCVDTETAWRRIGLGM